MPIVTERSIMDDNRIIELLFERAENALDEVSHKYSRLYKGIIREVLSDECDVEECEKDVLMVEYDPTELSRQFVLLHMQNRKTYRYKQIQI